MRINAGSMHFQKLNEQVRLSTDREIFISGCIGQRYIASGLSGKAITIEGTPGNALGAYLNGSELIVRGNAQDATGDTMNDGKIVIYGSSGDATGYAMRGGEIYVKGNVGYRAGIHMKAYQQKIPVLIVGGKAGSFLGEYQAGGYIVVLNLDGSGEMPMGYFCASGMHGGKIFLRCKEAPRGLPEQVSCAPAGPQDLAEIDSYLDEFCRRFEKEKSDILNETFFVVTPDSKNPYKTLYTHN